MGRGSCGFAVGWGGTRGKIVTGGRCGVRECLEGRASAVAVKRRIRGEAPIGMRFLASISRGGEGDLHGDGADLETRCWLWL